MWSHLSTECRPRWGPQFVRVVPGVLSSGGKKSLGSGTSEDLKTQLILLTCITVYSKVGTGHFLYTYADENCIGITDQGTTSMQRYPTEQCLWSIWSARSAHINPSIDITTGNVFDGLLHVYLLVYN